MSAVTASPDHQEVHHANGHEPSYASQLKRNRIGLWMFFFSELFMFGALLAARFALWGNTRPPLSQVLGLITTVVLLLSSFYMNRAESAIAHDDRKTLLSGLLTTGFLGTLFFIGVVVLEWNVFGLELKLFGVEWFGHLKPTDGVFGGVFFAMTGMHALHVVSGIIFILIVWNNSRKGHFSVEEHWGIEACAIYWHFVDVVWVFFYPALYLIGNAA
jgi:cytochrome c oxidase subunit 3